MKEKISKICWNDYLWSKPSGTNGKSPSSGAYENSQGYGHEEWLLDKSKIVEGYHYGFLQPLNLKSDKHVKQTYKIWLYTLTNKQKLLIGIIKKAICISKDESARIYQIYKRNGWIKEMANDLGRAGLSPKNLKETDPRIFFNLKFQFKDLEINEDFPVLSNDDRNLTTTRYKLLDKVSEFKYESIKLKGTEGFTRKTISEVFVDPYHNKIQNTLSRLLKESDLYRSIKMEENFVDIQATSNSDGCIHYFEVKANTPKNNIRQAIGQLIEYSMYPNKQTAQKLIVVGDTEPSSIVKKYIAHIRKNSGINIYYRWIDMDNKKLSEEI